MKRHVGATGAELGSGLSGICLKRLSGTADFRVGQCVAQPIWAQERGWGPFLTACFLPLAHPLPEGQDLVLCGSAALGPGT